MVPMPLGCRPWLLLTQMPLWWTYTWFMEDVSMWSVMLAVHKWLPKCGPSAIMLPWWVQEFHVSRVLNWVIVKGGQTLVLCPSPTSSEQHCFCVSKYWYWNALSQHAVIRFVCLTTPWSVCGIVWHCEGEHQPWVDAETNTDWWAVPGVHPPSVSTGVESPGPKASSVSTTSRPDQDSEPEQTGYVRESAFSHTWLVAEAPERWRWKMGWAWAALLSQWYDDDGVLLCRVGDCCSGAHFLSSFWGLCQPPFQSEPADVPSLGCLCCWVSSLFAGLGRPLFQAWPAAVIPGFEATLTVVSLQSKYCLLTPRQCATQNDAKWWFGTWILFSISYMGFHPSHWLSYVSRWFKATNHRIGLREILQENPIFGGKNHGFL